MRIKIRGIEYYFHIHRNENKRPYLVLLHGFLGSGKFFDGLISELSIFSNPVTVDLLGHGQTEGAELHYRFSAEEQTADLVKLIGEQLKTPLFLLGYSMGGRLALHLALKRPDLFTGIILESTTFGIEHPQERQARQALDAARADSLMGNYSDFLIDWENMPLFRTVEQPDNRMQFIRKIQGAQQPLWMHNSLLGFGTGTMPCVKEQLHTIKNPVLLLAGEKDSKFVHTINVMQKEIPFSRFMMVQNAGHRIHLEQPEMYIAYIREFIEQNKIP